MTEMKLFDKWEYPNIEVTDEGLKKYISIKPVMIPKTFGRNTQKQFHKSNMNIVERLVNHIYVSGHKRKRHFITSGQNVGKTMKIFTIIKEVFTTIEHRTKKNPIEVFVKSIENCAMREEVTSFQVGGIIVRKAVITAPQRRVDMVLREFAQSSYQKSVNNKKTMADCLADEIVAAYNKSPDSYAIRERERMEKESAGAR